MILVLSNFRCICAQQEDSRTRETVGHAIRLMNDGHVDESIKLLKETIGAHPDCYHCRYELAYAYSLKKDYPETVEILEKLEKHKDANDQLYQMLGNSYDDMGDSNKAMKVYRQGLEKFPNSGKLYLEQGIVLIRNEEYGKALEYFEKGIEKEPAFPSNYYWACRLFCGSDEDAWGMIYGEIFMNMERNTRRTSEISKLLYEQYRNNIKIDGNTVSVSFSKNSAVTSPKMLFGVGVYEPVLLASIASVRSIDIHTLDSIRTKFVGLYFEKGYEKLFPNVLFTYQQQIEKAGYLSAYNHWLLMQGDNNAFEEWHTENREEWSDFIRWFNENPMLMNRENSFHRN